MTYTIDGFPRFSHACEALVIELAQVAMEQVGNARSIWRSCTELPSKKGRLEGHAEPQNLTSSA